MGLQPAWPMPRPKRRTASCQNSVTKPVRMVVADQRARQPARMRTRRFLKLSAKIEMRTPVVVKTMLKTGPETTL